MDGQTKQEPTLKLNFLSHGTLEARDLEKSRVFYEEFLGLEVVRTSNVSLLIRLGGDNTIAVVQVPKKETMPLLNHNGLDVETQEEVDAAHALVEQNAEKQEDLIFSWRERSEAQLDEENSDALARKGGFGTKLLDATMRVELGGSISIAPDEYGIDVTIKVHYARVTVDYQADRSK